VNVVLIGYFPSSGPYTYGSVAGWAANAWEFNGHNVQRFDRSEMNKLPKKADIYFFVDCSEDYSQSMPNDLDGLKVFWAMDVQMPGGAERSVNIARKMDYVFCSNKIHGVDILEKFGIESTWVTYGYDYELQEEVLDKKPKGLIQGGDYTRELLQKNGETWIWSMPELGYRRSFGYDVCMIGNPNSPERVALWKLLKEKYDDRAAVGKVDNREEYVKIKGASRIIINQPTEPFNNIINLRVFNALACGKLLLCKRPQVSEHYMLGMRDGVNLVYWNDFDDLIEKVNYYLEHTDEADRIAAEGRKLGDKYLMPNQVRIIEQVLLSKFYDRLK
jgi:hypothetical protein